MSATMRSIATALNAVAVEDLSPGVREMLPRVEKLFQEIKNTWEGVESSLGRPGLDTTGGFYDSGFVKRWTIGSGGGGAFKFTNPNPNLVREIMDSDAGVGNERAWTGTTTGAFPGVADFTFPSYANCFVGLREGRGTLAMPWQLMRANRINKVLFDVAADNIKKSAELTALSEAICFLSRNPTWGEVLRANVQVAASDAGHAKVTATNFAGTASAYCLTFAQLHDEDVITKLRPGMSVDVWECVLNGSVPGTYIRSLHANGWVVDQIDYVNEKFTLVTKDTATATNAPVGAGAAPTGTGGTAEAFATGDFITYIVTLKDTCILSGSSSPTTFVKIGTASTWGATAEDWSRHDALDALIQARVTAGTGGCYAYGMDGLTGFVKTSAAQSYYGVPLSRMPNLVSVYKDKVGDYLTTRYWNRVVGWFIGQYGEDPFPDTIVTSFGVINGALQNAFEFGTESVPAASAKTPVVAKTWEMDGSTPKLTMDVGIVTMGHRGRKFKLYDSPMAMRKNLFAVKTRDGNFQRLMPPPIPGAGKEAQFQDIEFINTLGGSNGIWDFARNSSGAKTDFLEAPYVLTAQHYCEDPRMIRLRGITEAVGLT